MSGPERPIAAIQNADRASRFRTLEPQSIATVVVGHEETVTTRAWRPKGGCDDNLCREYVIDPKKIDAFEKFAKKWIDLVNRYGGRHHGYHLPAEGASDRALALLDSDPARAKS